MSHRDRLGPETRAVLKALALLVTDYPEVIQRGLWTFRKFGKVFYRIFPTDFFITMTGADVNTQLRIPFDHKWIRTDFYHTLAGAADVSVASLLISIQRRAGVVEPIADFVEFLFHEDRIRHAQIGENWGENFEYEATTWDIILNSDNTDLVYPIFVVERLA